MNDFSPLSSPSTGHSRSPWNKDKIIGPRPPLRPGHVWSIRAKLHLELRARDLALFNLAIPNVRQRKTGRPVRFELTEQTRESLDVSPQQRSEAGAGSVSRSRRPRSVSDDAAVRAPGGAMGCQRRS